LHEELSALRGSLDQYARFSFKNFPLSSHQFAEPAARAALAAHQQGKFWPYFDLLFTRQKKIDADKFSLWAEELGLDVPRFEADFQSAALSEQVAADRAEALALGLTGTPVLFINQRPHLDQMTREAIWDAVVFLLAEQGAAPLPEPPR
jgi:protein-disulfide isomerase